MRVRQNSEAAWRVLEGHAFIVPHGATGVVELDDVATFIWCLLETEHAFEDVVRRVCEEFDVEPVRARADCLAFFDEMARRGLVTTRADGP